MQVEELLNSGLNREYKVVITAADIDGRLTTILNEYRTKVKMNGFRPGKAPLSLLKKLHGERAMGQVIQESVNASVEKLYADNDIRPASRPDIDFGDVNPDSIKEGSDMSFIVKVEALPNVDITNFKAPALERLTATTSDAAVDEFCVNLAAQQKRFEKAAKTTKAENGMSVLMDFVGKIDDVAFEGGSGEDFQLELGSGSFIPGFEDQLVGVKSGDKKAVKVNFPAEYHAENLAGKAAIFDCVIKEVQKAAQTKVDDEFAKSLGLEGLAALKELGKTNLEGELAQLSRSQVKRSLLDALAKQYTFDVPKSMVDMEFESIWNQIKQDMVQSGEATYEEVGSLTEPADADEAAEFKSIAERRVRLGLLLSEIGTVNKIQVTEQEVNQRIVQEVRRYPGQEQQVFEFYQKNEQARAQMRAPIFEEKVVDFILEMADLTDKVVSKEELEKIVREGDEEETTPAKKSAKKKAPAKKVPAKKPAAKKADAEPAAKKAAAKKAPAKK